MVGFFCPTPYSLTGGVCYDLSMNTSKSKTHEYRGYQIVRHENGQTNCPGNPWPGSKFYYTVTKNETEITSYGTLRQAKVFIDTKLDRTPEEKKRIADLLATLS